MAQVNQLNSKEQETKKAIQKATSNPTTQNQKELQPIFVFSHEKCIASLREGIYNH